MKFEQNINEVQESKEKGESPNVEFFVTDHNLLYEDRSSDEHQREIYTEMNKHGLDSVRFDLWWKELAPEANNEHRQEIVERYANAIRMMKEEGLTPPTLVISNPPAWAQELYNSGKKEAYLEAYQAYLDDVAKVIELSGGESYSLQVFNEINHSLLFKYVDIDDLPRIAQMIRDTVGKVQSDVKLSTSLIIANMNEKIANVQNQLPEEDVTTIGFIKKHEALLRENFDIISFDYYPGVWHMPIADANLILKDVYKNLDALREVCEVVASWGKEYEIGEVGFPTNSPYNSEKRQRYFYDTFFKAFREMLVDFKERGIKAPSRVGLYETEDEANISFGGIMEKILKNPIIHNLSKLTPNPEHDFGLKKAGGKPKMILKGNRHKKIGGDFESVKDDESQLSKIISYVNRPIK